MSIAVISSWMFLIVPDLKNSTKFFEINVEAEGIWLLLDSIESMQYTEYHVRSNFFQEVIQENDNLLEIKSTWIGKDIVLNDVLWESEQVVFVEKNSRKDIEFNSYYAFPYNTQKQSYEFWNFGDKPYSLHFEKLVNFNGVELYEFSSFDTYDISGGYTEFPDEQIFTDDKTVFLVEPSTGLIVGIDTKFSDYAIKDGRKIIFGEGTETTTEYSKTILTERAKNQISLFHFYDVVVPIFLTIIFVVILIGTFLHLRLKGKEIEIEKISTNASAKLLTIKETDRQKDEFASMITHELKTPLTPIRGYCEMLQDESFGNLTKDQIYYVEKIDSSAVILERLIGDVLDVQKLDMGKMSFNKESFDVCNFLDRLKQDYSSIMKDKEIEFVVTDPVTTTLKTDQLRLLQVLENLIRFNPFKPSFVVTQSNFFTLRYLESISVMS